MDGTGSVRLTEARLAAGLRSARQRARLRPLAWVVFAVVAITAANGRPQPGSSGTHLGVLLALVAYAVAFALVVRLGGHESRALQVALTLLLGAAGIALAVLQPHGPVELAPSVAVWTAAARLELAAAAAVGIAITGALDVAIARTETHSAQSAAAATLLCALLWVTAQFLRRANESQERAERLLAELEDARDAQAEAAALAERSRIARDLHDVLAQSLSGLAIQLESARVLGEREGAGAELRTAIARAGGLARDGLDDARRAVGALRGDPPDTVERLDVLVRRFRGLELEVELESLGERRPLRTEASVALYRAAQEALTNVLRYAPGARARVSVSYEDAAVRLTVENGAGAGERPALMGAGGGRGLLGMRERIEGLGGRMHAGTTGPGFRVEVEVPG